MGVLKMGRKKLDQGHIYKQVLYRLEQMGPQ